MQRERSKDHFFFDKMENHRCMTCAEISRKLRGRKLMFQHMSFLCFLYKIAIIKKGDIVRVKNLINRLMCFDGNNFIMV